MLEGRKTKNKGYKGSWSLNCTTNDEKRSKKKPTSEKSEGVGRKERGEKKIVRAKGRSNYRWRGGWPPNMGEFDHEQANQIKGKRLLHRGTIEGKDEQGGVDTSLGRTEGPLCNDIGGARPESRDDRQRTGLRYQYRKRDKKKGKKVTRRQEGLGTRPTPGQPRLPTQEGGEPPLTGSKPVRKTLRREGCLKLD